MSGIKFRKVLEVTADPKCVACFGEGYIYDFVPYGSTTASMCSCIEEQIPEGFDDYEIEVVSRVEGVDGIVG